MKRVLVTGGGGYIGSVLIGTLLDAGFAVTALDRFFFGEQTLGAHRHREGLRIVKQDIRDIEARQLEDVHAICDLAAFSNDPSGDLDPDITCAVNWRGRARLADLARRAGVGRYVLSSSCSVYGHSADDELSEATKPAPLSIYAKANVHAEEEVLALAGDDVCVTVLRNPTVFGISPRMRFDLVINLMTLDAVRRGRIFVTGGGKQRRPLAHVGDVAQAFLSVIEAPAAAVNGQVFNVGAENACIRTLAYIVRETVPFPLQIEIVPDDADKRDYSVSFRKIREVLGFQPRLAIADGVREIYEALKSGALDDGPMTSTVQWYRTILEAKTLIERVELNGRLL